MKRKTLSFIMAAALIFSSLPVALPVAAAEDFTISTAAELEAFRDSVNAGNDYSGATVTLTADIDLGGSAEHQWTPIGTKYMPFGGTFDGGGHTITGLYINQPDSSYQGLFGSNTGTIQNLGVDGSVTGSMRVSGIVGDTAYGAIKNCYNHCAVTGVSMVGGIAGANGDRDSGTSGCEITKCYNTGAISGETMVAGIAGGSGEHSNITNCYNTGAVSGSDSSGGIAGRMLAPGVLSNCYNIGAVSGGSGIIGDCIGAGEAKPFTITSCYYLAGTATGGFDGADTSGQTTAIEKNLFEHSPTFEGWDFETVWDMDVILGRPVLRALAEDSYRRITVSTLAELEAFRDSVNAGEKSYDLYVTLAADIDLGGSEQNQWTPIGTKDISFGGIFDGAGHKITGLHINRPNDDYQGLFAHNAGTIQNLCVDGSVTGGAYVGGIVGNNNTFGWLQNCCNHCTVKGGMIVGGIAGGHADTQFGISDHCKILRCYNTGSVSGNELIGGIAGGSGNDSNIADCYNTGAVSGKEFAGGIVGRAVSVNDGSGSAGGARSVITNCYNIGAVSGGSGITNGVDGEITYTVTNCYYLTDTASGGLDGADVAGQAEAIDNTAFARQSAFVNWDFENVWKIDNTLSRPILREIPESAGKTEITSLVISTLAELQAFRDSVNAGNDYSGTTVMLAADIDLGGRVNDDYGIITYENQWTPIGTLDKPFAGTFNGGDHKISGLCINDVPGNGFQGLFGRSSGTIQNLSVSGDVRSMDYTGGIVGKNEGSILNCHHDGVVGNAGRRADTIGGITGYNLGSIINCSHSGAVAPDSSSEQVGGIVGWNEGSITNCHNDGTVGGNMFIGGIAGNNDGSISGCYNTGAISGHEWAGGIVDSNGTKAIVSNCYNTGSIGASSTGGVVRTNGGTVINCYNTGRVSGSSYIGGIVSTCSGTVTNCYSVGSIRGNSAVGGIAGNNLLGNLSNCYYLADTAAGGIGHSGTTASDDVAGQAEPVPKTAFAQQSTFVNWDFETVWALNESLGRPVLCLNAEDGSGGGTMLHTITNLAALEALRDSVNAGNDYSDVTVVLAADIDLGGSEEHQWTPIGSADAPFAGTFDGGGHEISGLYINQSKRGDQGLFGFNTGTIQNLGVAGVVTGGIDVGGIAGENSYGTIKNCYNTCTITGETSVGGITGSSTGKIICCYNTGAVTGEPYIGGIAGANLNIVTDCYNTGAVTGIGCVGGITGYNIPGEMTNCYNIGTISGGSGITNGTGSGASCIVTHCYYLVNTATGGLGNSAGGLDRKDVLGQAEAIEKSAFAKSFTFDGWDFETVWKIDNTIDRPVLRAIPEDSLKDVTISTAAELEAFRDSVNAGNDYHNLTITLAADIDLGGSSTKQWTPIGTKEAPFAGTFEGREHKITGLYIDQPDSAYQGLFGYSTGTIQNVKVAGTVTGSTYVGGIVGQHEKGSVSYCSVTGNITGTERVGGIVGFSEGTITDCHHDGTITGESCVGGIVGENGYNRMVSSCYHTGAMNAPSGAMVGGIVGRNASYGNILVCYNTGDINCEGGSHAGGIVGWNTGKIKDCYTTGAVSALSNIGGVAGYNDTQNSSIQNCYNIGAVRRKAGFTGSGGVGIIGDANRNPAGIVGNNRGVVTDCYYLTGASTIGGIGNAGLDGADVAGQAWVLDKEAFAQKGSFSGWGFDYTWRMDELLGRPILRSIPESSVTISGKTVTAVYGTAATQDLSAFLASSGIDAPQYAYVYTITSGNDTLGAAVGGDTLTVPATAAIGDYSLLIQATAKSQTKNPLSLTLTVTVTVNKADPSYTAPAAKTGLTYNGKPQALITAGQSVDGTMQYSLNGRDYSASIPTGTDAKTYTVYYKVLGDSNHNDSAPQTLSVTISGGGGSFGGGGGGGAGGGGGGGGNRGGSCSGGVVPIPVATPAPVTPPSPDTTPNTPTQSGSFTDVYSGEWYASAVEFVRNCGLMTGVSETEFAPEADVTRAMFVTVLYRLENQPDLSNEILGYPFADVDAQSWYGNAVYWARQNGIVAGVSDELFAPEENITREQMAAILYRYAKYKAYDTAANGNLNYTDSSAISDYAAEATVWAADKGILQGNEDGTFAPAANATRAQTAAVFQRIVQQLQ